MNRIKNVPFLSNSILNHTPTLTIMSIQFCTTLLPIQIYPLKYNLSKLNESYQKCIENVYIEYDYVNIEYINVNNCVIS